MTREGLAPRLNLIEATAIGVGAVIGAGVFVLSGLAAGIAGPSVVLSFLIAGVTAFLTAVNSAELASFIPEAGGSYAFAERAFGRFFGFLVGWVQTFDYVVGGAAVSVGFAAYLGNVVPLAAFAFGALLIAAALPIALLILNLAGSKHAAATNVVLVVVKIVALVLFVAVGGAFLVGGHALTHFVPFFPRGPLATFAGASVIFFAFVGFNTVTTMAEEIRDPQRNVPRAIIATFAIATLLYVAVALVEVGLLDWRALGASSAPLETALRAATSNVYVLGFVSASALFATASVVMSTILASSRVVFAMSRKGDLPRVLASVSRRAIPSAALVLTGGAMAVIVVAAGANLAWLASVFNFGTLLTFSMINLSALRLRRTAPDAPRAFRVPWAPVPQILGVLACLALLFSLRITAGHRSLRVAPTQRGTRADGRRRVSVASGAAFSRSGTERPRTPWSFPDASRRLTANVRCGPADARGSREAPAAAGPRASPRSRPSPCSSRLDTLSRESTSRA
ncbi:MAG: APC family permease [Thermoplasmatota archaeon]